jgi:predicted MFS family arabinose efflux permease
LVALSRPARPVSRPALTLLLAFAMGVASVVTFIIGALAPFMVAELGLSRTSLGLLATGMIGVAAVLSPLAGYLVDRLGGRPMLLLIFAATAAGLLGMAAAGSYGWLIAGAAVAGIGSAMGNPATNQLISRYVPRGSQGSVIGVKQSGVQGATFLAGLLLPSLGAALGWRRAMAVSALPVLLGLGGTLLIVPAAPPVPGAERRERGAGHTALVARLTVYGCLMGIGVSALGSYAVLYGVEVLGLSASAGGLAIALLGLAGVVSRIVWARRIERGAPASVSLVLMAAGGAVSVALIWLAQDAGSWLLWAGALGFGATATAWNAVGNLVLVRALPAAVAGRMAGILQGGFYAGFAAGPAGFGLLVDATGSYGAGWSMVIVALVTAGGLLAAWAGAERRGTRRQA